MESFGFAGRAVLGLAAILSESVLWDGWRIGNCGRPRWRLMQFLTGFGRLKLDGTEYPTDKRVMPGTNGWLQKWDLPDDSAI
jgi:hypothetical protein